ncbi:MULTISPECIES: hypothetical protein [Streptomyces]|uniref:hypothetical protein n=1 Tax=Streptomyces TaxID=1883 RepID=UPI0004AB8104|nr:MULTISPECIES: hypothetical protein [Streptomyces]
MGTFKSAASLALLVALSATAVGCGEPDHAVLGSKKQTCQLDLKSGQSATIGGQTSAVENVDDNSVTLDSHAIAITLRKGIDVTFGRSRLHLGKTEGGTVGLEVKDQ